MTLDIEELRERTGASRKDCKSALRKANGNIDQAYDILDEEMKKNPNKLFINDEKAILKVFKHRAGLGIMGFADMEFFEYIDKGLRNSNLFVSQFVDLMIENQINKKTIWGKEPAALSSADLVLKYGGSKVQNDKNIVMKICSLEGNGLEFCSNKLSWDQEVVAVAMKNEPRAIKFAYRGGIPKNLV